MCFSYLFSFFVPLKPSRKWRFSFSIMISKRCNRCGKRVQIGKSCTCMHKNKYKTTAADKYSVDDKKFYLSSEWQKARSKCISSCYGLDLYSYYVLHKIEYGQTVHHIVPLLDDYSQRLSQENLIYLTESNHRLIHALYQSEYNNTCKLLKSIVASFLNELEV